MSGTQTGCAIVGGGRVRDRQLAAVPRRRELPTRVIQAMQALVQTRLLAPALDERPFDPPKPLRLPLVRDLPARGLAFGMWRVRVAEPGTGEVSRRTLW